MRQSVAYSVEWALNYVIQLVPVSYHFPRVLPRSAIPKVDILHLSIMAGCLTQIKLREYVPCSLASWWPSLHTQNLLCIITDGLSRASILNSMHTQASLAPFSDFLYDGFNGVSTFGLADCRSTPSQEVLKYRHTSCSFFQVWCIILLVNMHVEKPMQNALECTPKMESHLSLLVLAFENPPSQCLMRLHRNHLDNKHHQCYY